MTVPKVRAETSATSPEGSRQAVKSNEGAGVRIKDALDGREVSWLVRETGYGDSTIRDAIRRGPVRSDVAVAIANALGVTVDWLLNGKRGNAVVDVNDAEWVEIGEHSLLEIDETGKMPPFATTMVRLDWLYSTLGESADLWITRLLTPYDPLSLSRGTILVCKDIRPGERLLNGLYYLFRINEGIVMAPYALKDQGGDELTVTPREIGHDEDQYQPVARIVGQLARPL